MDHQWKSAVKQLPGRDRKAVHVGDIYQSPDGTQYRFRGGTTNGGHKTQTPWLVLDTGAEAAEIPPGSRRIHPDPQSEAAPIYRPQCKIRS